MNSIDVEISDIFPHELYGLSDPNKQNDIALLRLESVVTFTKFVQPICVPTDKSQYLDYGSTTVTGFGKTETKNSSEVMLKAEVDIVDHSTCKRKYRVQGRTILDSQICAIKYNADTW